MEVFPTCRQRALQAHPPTLNPDPPPLAPHTWTAEFADKGMRAFLSSHLNRAGGAGGQGPVRSLLCLARPDHPGPALPRTLALTQSLPCPPGPSCLGHRLAAWEGALVLPALARASASSSLSLRILSCTWEVITLPSQASPPPKQNEALHGQASEPA